MKKFLTIITMGIAILILTGSMAMAGGWQVSTYVDDFGDSTGERYMVQQAIGKFSNSATANSDCYFKFFVDRDGTMSIRLKEYKTSQPIKYFTMHEASVKMKNSSGGIYDAIEYNPEGYLIQFLKKSVGMVKVRLRGKYSARYKFDLNANGFTDAYNELMKKDPK